MTTYLTFIDVLLHDLMGYRVMKDYIALFHSHDDNSQRIAEVNELQANQLRTRFHQEGILFSSLQWVDSIFARVYTKFLEINAQKQRKDHGQFYTPQSIVRFMWNGCLQPSQSGLQPPSLTQVPRVFDPCMGMGAFLCEFLTRLIDACTVIPSVWNNLDYLTYVLCHAIPENIWGVEIDPFAFQLGKLNVLVHLFPLYKRIMELSLPNDSPPTLTIHRLHLFRNDTLKLTLYPDGSAWEHAELLRLRDPTRLKFDYIVTNPPYMIRKTGLVTEPDPALYDGRVLGGRGAQAYLYFMWICMLRCDPLTGQICLITPSQWIVLEFAQHLRAWMWQHCQLLGMYQFEPYKVWPKVQTDSLIFRLRMRQQVEEGAGEDSRLVPTTSIPTPTSSTSTSTSLSPPAAAPSTREGGNKILFLRHMSRKAKLDDILYEYTQFLNHASSIHHHHPLNIDKLFHTNSNHSHDPLLKFKWTNTDPIDRIQKSPHASFAFLSPTSKLSDQLNDLTSGLPRICDSDDAPLEFHRGPNTNPVYALVVRTQWAYQTFGQTCCDRWLRPAIYWSGKSQGTDKESQFWLERDPFRLARKEVSPAEAYVPLYRTDEHGHPFYSMILVDKEGAEQLEKNVSEYHHQQQKSQGQGQEEGKENVEIVMDPLREGEIRLYHYLREAREALQSNKDERTMAWCHYNKCGVDIPVKIVHPINYGYFTKSQPRQRFFMDRNQFCLTNQCMYFTTKNNNPPSSSSSSNTLPSSPSPEYYCALLNSSTVQFFIKEHCSYDQQGRTRFFGKHLANIPCPLPPTQKESHIMTHLVHLVSTARIRIYSITELTKLQTLMEKVRGGSWDLSVTDIACLQKFDQVNNPSVPPLQGDQPPSSSEEEQDKRRRDWRTLFGWQDHHRYPTLLDAVIRTLQRASLCQYAIDQMAYTMYQIPQELQHALECELNLTLTKKWQTQLDQHTQRVSITQDRYAWGQCIIELIHTI
ncbi:S-adenosyl-L-methionine-dependent methyltransferase [Phascolomyces articulosus]|uniref:site-specific DNA-methyltransferase (adenine-specific) n=1 Tax=Phascolomyces articulosus TaxID=60185 RepID=A0AAD5KJ10_9FUNG|nr:S-adenosyl-L-methionine-dependent methyltransferase [Phascolomyces articulosus]